MKNVRRKFKSWLLTPPPSTDLFFTRIREAIQTITPCKHEEWEKDNYTRRCLICGEYQVMKLAPPYDMNEPEWVSYRTGESFPIKESDKYAKAEH